MENATVMNYAKDEFHLQKLSSYENDVANAPRKLPVEADTIIMLRPIPFARMVGGPCHFMGNFNRVNEGYCNRKGLLAFFVGLPLPKVE